MLGQLKQRVTAARGDSGLADIAVAMSRTATTPMARQKGARKSILVSGIGARHEALRSAAHASVHQAHALHRTLHALVCCNLAMIL
jgi:hypothetical protein